MIAFVDAGLVRAKPRRAPGLELQRCACGECLALDRKWPKDGWQAMLFPVFDHFWFWRTKRPDRKGQRCRIVSRGNMNSILVEFPDGERVVTGRTAVRRMK